MLGWASPPMYNGSSPAVSYGPLGIGSAIYGSGDSDTWSYDAAGHINNIKTAVGSGGQYYQSNVTWNASGTVKQLVTTDTVTGGTHNDVTDAYAYDDMGRVSTATGVSTMAETYTYDRYGNITTSGYPSSWVPGYDTTTNRFTATNCNPGGICYDLDGNLLTDPSHTYTWDAEDKQASIDGHAITRDAFGRAVEELCTTGCTAFQTVYGPGGKVALAIGQTIYTARIPLPGGGNAVYNWTSGTEGLDHYDHPDWLGNARIQTTPAGSLWAQREYTPFGVPYDATACPTGCDLLFNGGSQDTASGEYDTENRELNSVQGRWIQPDPAGFAAVDITNPQTWNQYAYVTNNPVSMSDPSGLAPDFCGAEFGSCGGDGGGGGGGTDANGIPWNFGPGYVMTRVSGLSQINAGLVTYLNSIPWYSVVGGHLLLQTSSGWSFVTNPNFNPEDPNSTWGSMVGTETLFDLGPASTLVALAQQQYIEPMSFTTAFFRNFSVFGPSKTKPSCFGNFLRDTLKGFVGVPGVDTVAGAGGAYYGISALTSEAPPVSAALRGGLSVKQWISADNAARLSEAGRFGLWSNVVLSEGQAIANEYGSATSGQCD